MIKRVLNKNNFYKTLHHLKNGNFGFILQKFKTIIKDHISQKNLKVKIDHDLFTFMFQQNNVQDQAYKKFKKHIQIEDNIRTIAFYLPQFHPIKENDENWGKGFTEWTNVSKAIPQFYGHYQPRLPGELGFYDLRLKEVRHRQVELAKNYGIDGFCFHFYWFNGRRVLEKPLEDFIADKELDFPFCVNWANENWTRRWDGLESDILLEQKYSDKDDLAFIETVSKIFKDPRYIKVDGKPLLMIYRVSLFPDIKATVKRWRAYCQKEGIGEIYLVLTHSFEHTDPTEIGFDAAVEFSPNTFSVKVQNANQKFYNQNYNGMVFDYDDAVLYSLNMKKPDYTKFKTVFPSWDNEARKPGAGTSFINSTPQKYEKWLKKIYRYTKQHLPERERFVFINAWNEWAEGAYLEPDRKYGYAYLEASYLAKYNYDLQKVIVKDGIEKKFIKSSQRAVIVHLYYFDLWRELCQYLKKFDDDIDIYININNKFSEDEIDQVLSDTPNANIFVFENRGRDILPFLKIMKLILPLEYRYIYKIHSKKSPHRNDGNQWRMHLIESIMGTKDRIKQVETLMDQKDIGLVIARGNKLYYKDWIGSNRDMIQSYCNRVGLPYHEEFVFPAGSIFCLKPEIMQQFILTLNDDDFAKEEGQVDGTMAHAVERIIGLVLENMELRIEEV
jgi:lipopolysaccharide biosynthesis protein